MQNNPRTSVLKLAHEKTGAGDCWLVEVKREKSKVKSSELFGEPVEFGELAVWQETSSTVVSVPLKKIKK
jgi:hypothetical protein